jgi:hypothetical protein
MSQENVEGGAVHVHGMECAQTGPAWPRATHDSVRVCLRADPALVRLDGLSDSRGEPLVSEIGPRPAPVAACALLAGDVTPGRPANSSQTVGRPRIPPDRCGSAVAGPGARFGAVERDLALQSRTCQRGTQESNLALRFWRPAVRAGLGPETLGCRSSRDRCRDRTRRGGWSRSVPARLCTGRVAQEPSDERHIEGRPDLLSGAHRKLERCALEGYL